jgi:serine/threonine protein phosphatase PrpC
MPARILVDHAMQEPERHAFAGGELCLFTAPPPGQESGNQDGAALVELGPGRGVLAVADGLGGQPAGDKAARIALESLVDAVLENEARGGTLRHAVMDGFERGCERVQDLGVGAATTLVVVEIDGGHVRTYHVGDSMILVVGQRGRRKLQTVSHSPVGYAVEAGVLDESEALHHDELNLISNMVGAADMRIEVGSRRALSPRDTILLASDGLLDNLHLEEIVEMIRRGPLDAAARRLLEKCHERMGGGDADEPSKPDDTTFVIFRPRARREGRPSPRRPSQ